jgi:DNA-directed RNA polymerase
LTGARDQIKNRLFEVFYPDKSYIMSSEQENILNKQSLYMAKVTLASLSELFQRANAIMGWLADAAVLVGQQDQAMSWKTPLGLPVIQPYRRFNQYCIKTVMQSMYFFDSSDEIPVSRKRQRSAFSPNFVHSLDSTHMLMTALKMKEAGLSFASVHDSYWTHACSIEEMARLLRVCFVELYSQPVLENLRNSLIVRYPEINFPPLPNRGDLDIKDVLHSKFFFH